MMTDHGFLLVLFSKLNQAHSMFATCINFEIQKQLKNDRKIKNSDKQINYQKLYKLSAKEINHFYKAHNPKAETGIKCLMYDVDSYLDNQTQKHAKK